MLFNINIQNAHLRTIVFPFYANFIWDFVPRLHSKGRQSRGVQINCVSHWQEILHLLLKGTYLKKRGLTLFVSSFGGTLDYTLYMNYDIVVIISLHFKTTSKNSYSKLSVWPTNILAEHCAAPKKQAGSG